MYVNIFSMSNYYNKNALIKIICLVALILTCIKTAYALETNSCYILIEGKSGCSGLTDISDVEYTSQLKCFTIDKSAKDCGLFVNVLPTDTSQGLSTGLEPIDCTGANKNSVECADYCFNNPNASPSECIDCDSLTEAEKANYPYCQDKKNPEYCKLISNDGNGSSWPQTLAGVINVIGTCLDGYEIDDETGVPTRNCSNSAIWEDISSPCIPAKCDAIGAVAGATYANGYATWAETSRSTTGVVGSCVQDYKQATVGVNPTRDCSNKGQWQEVSDYCIPVVCDYIYDTGNHVQWPETIPGSNTTVEVNGTCDTGYEPADNAAYAVRLCNRDGSWGSVIVECVLKKCNNSELNTLNPLSNSEYYYTSLGISPTGKSDYETTVNGDCSTGYKKTNSGDIISATCNSDGEWDFIPSTDTGLCEIKTCTISSAQSYAPSNLVSWTSDGEFYPVNDASSTINYGETISASACNTGYSYSGTLELECTDTNTWSIVGTNNGVCTAQCTWSNLNTLTFSTSGLTSTLLTSVNSWYDGTGTSVAKPTSSTQYYDLGTVYQVDCPTGYTTNTKKKITCNAGSWNTTTADVCVIKTCSINDLNDDTKIDALTDPNISGNTTNKNALKLATFNAAGTTQHLGSTSSIGCETGYSASGSISMICNDGEWTWNTANSSANYCTMNTCTIASATTAASISNISSTSAWALCTNSSCSTTTTTYGSSATTTVNYGSYIKFNACNTGYVLGGSTIMQCTGSNTWTAVGTSNGVCTPTCSGSGLLSLILNASSEASWYICPTNNVSCTSSTIESSATTLYPQNTYAYLSACNSGYTKSATARYKCTNLNTWTVQTAATCNPNPCSTSTLTAYKTSKSLPITIGTSDTIASGSTRTYTCNSGYSGSVTLSCSIGGITGHTGSCNLITCPAISPTSYVANGIFTTTNGTCANGTSSMTCPGAVYTLSSCDTNYSRVGSMTIKCISDESWI